MRPGAGTTLFVSNGFFRIARAQGLGVLNILNGAVVSNTSGTASGIGDGSGASGGSTGIVTVANGGKWSTFSVNLGKAGAGGGVGQMIVQGPGSSVIGDLAGGTGALTIDAPGGFNSSLVVSNGGYVAFGSQITVGSGTVMVASGGILESANQWNITAGKSGSISNVGGIYQFSSGTPSFNIVPGSMVLSNGTISFRARNDVNVFNAALTNITYNGQNTFRMDAASNTSVRQNYIFDTGRGATNYANLELINGANWRNSDWLTIGAGGSLLVSNSVASSVDGVVTNAGKVSVVNSTMNWLNNFVFNGGTYTTVNGTNNFAKGATVASGSALTFTNGNSLWSGVLTNAGNLRAINSQVTFQGPVVLSGSYFSDPSTNTFNSNLTVTASGSLYGSNGDLFVFNRDFLNGSTNRTSFNLVNATMLFTNGTGTTNHTLSLVGSDAFDKGSNWLSITDLATNFAIGTLSLAAGNTLSITGAMGGGVSNALYVGTLDLQGLTDTNQLASRLWLGINLYYDEHQSGNAYLHGLTYDLPGLGLLIPIPEPSAFAAALAGLGLLVFLRRRK